MTLFRKGRKIRSTPKNSHNLTPNQWEFFQNGVRTSGENPTPRFKLIKHLQIQHERGTQILP